MTAFSLATFRIGGKPVPVIEVGGKAYDLSVVAPQLIGNDLSSGLLPLFRDWKRSEADLMELAGTLPAGKSGEVTKPSDASDILAPLLYPSKVICTGANYSDHLKELGFPQFDKTKARAPFFLKPPATTVVGSGRSMHAPKGVSQFDWEIELTAVIGTRARNVSVQSALDYVAGYTIGIDLSARDLLLHPDNVSKMDVFGGKAFDGSCPLGPCIVPARFVGDPQNLHMKLSVNGVLKQNASTSLMIWNVAEQIAEISTVTTLEPGDLILTGTPAGAAYPHGPFLKAGDRIDAEIERIGSLHIEILP
jgi:2-keto-4-pentenoate hydratase/2-oxohepta-3-ene-1,7-dioic acid hydratase in catechol pathway